MLIPLTSLKISLLISTNGTKHGFVEGPYSLGFGCLLRCIDHMSSAVVFSLVGLVDVLHNGFSVNRISNFACGSKAYFNARSSTFVVGSTLPTVGSFVGILGVQPAVFSHMALLSTSVAGNVGPTRTAPFALESVVVDISLAIRLVGLAIEKR